MEPEHWKEYSFSWRDCDGRLYSSSFYAQDRYHAGVVLEDIKQNATLDGEIFESGDFEV